MTTSVQTPTAPQSLATRALFLAAQALAFLRALSVLFKLRIVGLLLFSGTGGAFLAAHGWPGLGSLALMALTGGLAAAGASALNQYLELDEDTAMRRTRKRPLVTGAITRSWWVPVMGVGMIVVPALAVLPTNPALAFFSTLGAVIYIGIYTVWLKPRTVLNIVIGGAAGSCAVLSGGAAAGAWNDPGVLALALLVFLWTPAHFWSLAMMYREDYARAGVPMLPTRVSARQTVAWILIHATGTGAVALALALHPALGPLYMVVAALFTVDLLLRGKRLWSHPVPAQARDMFMASNIYLAVILLAVCVDAVIRM